MKLVINTCFGGFELSKEAYERLGAYGVPIQKYVEEKRDPKNSILRLAEPKNDGEVIFDRRLSDDALSQAMCRIHENPYWDMWTRENRNHPLLLKVIKDLGPDVCSGRFAKLKVIEIPDDVEYTIEEYDGVESVHEVHREWS